MRNAQPKQRQQKTKTVHIRLTESEKKALDSLAASLNITTCEIIRASLTGLLNFLEPIFQEKEPPRPRGRPRKDKKS